MLAKSMIQGMNKKTALKYLKTRNKIDKYVDNIWALSKMLSVFSDFPLGQEGKLDLCTFGKVGELIAKDIGKIVSSLDEDFIHPIEVEEELNHLRQ